MYHIYPELINNTRLSNSIKLTIIWQNSQHHIALSNEVTEYFCIDFCPRCILVCYFCIWRQAKSLNDWKKDLIKLLFIWVDTLSCFTINDWVEYIYIVCCKQDVNMDYYFQCIPFYIIKSCTEMSKQYES